MYGRKIYDRNDSFCSPPVLENIQIFDAEMRSSFGKTSGMETPFFFPFSINFSLRGALNRNQTIPIHVRQNGPLNMKALFLSRQVITGTF